MGELNRTRTRIRDQDDGPGATAPADGQALVWSEAAGRYLPGSAGGAASVGFTAENKAGVTLPAGTPVATHSSGVGVVAASAAGNGTPCVGLLGADTAAGFGGPVVTAGPLALADWSAVTGAATLANATYYLSASAGQATPAAPSAGINQRLFAAVSPTTAVVQISRPMKL